MCLYKLTFLNRLRSFSWVKKSNLELACEQALGERSKGFHHLLSELLLLNPHAFDKNDERFTAQFTIILFDNSFENKIGLICSLIDENECNLKTKLEVINHAKSLLGLDPGLEYTRKILNELKELGDLQYKPIKERVANDSRLKQFLAVESYSRRKLGTY